MGESKEVKKKEVKKKDPPAKEKPAEKAPKKDDKKAVEKKVKAKDAKGEEKAEKPVKKDAKAKAEEKDKAKVAEGKKRKKEEKVKEKVKEPEPVEEEDSDTRKVQEGVVEVDDAVPESAPRKSKGACAAEALDEDGTKNGKTKSSKKLGQADREDRSRSRDAGKDEKPKAAKARDEKEKEKGDKGKTKDKSKAKAPEKQEKAAKEKEREEDSSYSSEESSNGAAKRRLKRRADAGLKPASGFSLAPPPAPESSFVGPAPNPLAVLPSVPAPVQNLLGADVTSELVRMRQAVEAATGKPVEPRLRLDQREEEQETKLKMTEELREGLLDPANQKQLLARTSLLSATLAEDGQVVLRAPSKQSLKDAMSVLARVAHHCQWGCNPTKVGLLLREKPEQPVHTVLVRLAATSSRMQTQEGRVNQRQEKLRVGTDATQCQIALEPIAGISRKHVTITFEYDKGGCYVQDMSTNGTRLNGKRLPRPPYKHPMDARVRIFHGDELVLAITPEGEELGFVVNLFELSG